MMRILATGFLIFLIIHTAGFCQTDSNSDSDGIYFKNVVFGTLGAIPNVAYNFNYERQVTNPVRDTNSINLRIGYGGSSNLGGSEKMVLLSTNFIFGNSPGHMELDLGAAYLFDIVRSDTSKKTGITPVINVGYRFQKRDGQIVFRAGDGWPDCVYLSLGFAL